MSGVDIEGFIATQRYKIEEEKSRMMNRDRRVKGILPSDSGTLQVRDQLRKERQQDYQDFLKAQDHNKKTLASVRAGMASKRDAELYQNKSVSGASHFGVGRGRLDASYAFLRDKKISEERSYVGHALGNHIPETRNHLYVSKGQEKMKGKNNVNPFHKGRKSISPFHKSPRSVSPKFNQRATWDEAERGIVQWSQHHGHGGRRDKAKTPGDVSVSDSHATMRSTSAPLAPPAAPPYLSSYYNDQQYRHHPQANYHPREEFKNQQQMPFGYGPPFLPLPPGFHGGGGGGAGGGSGGGGGYWRAPLYPYPSYPSSYESHPDPHHNPYPYSAYSVPPGGVPTGVPPPHQPASYNTKPFSPELRQRLNRDEKPAPHGGKGVPLHSATSPNMMHEISPTASRRRDRDKGPTLDKDVYRKDLKRQMDEKRVKEVRDKLAQETFDNRKDTEIYDPFGKGGCGAPVRDQHGNLVADLKKMRKINENRLSDKSPRLNRSKSSEGVSPSPEDSPRQTILTYDKRDDEITKHSDQLNYRDYLRQQVREKEEEKKREKDRVRCEEQKELEQLQRDRQRMQEEYESELKKQRKKEEDVRRKNEAIKLQAEDERRRLKMKHERESIDEARELRKVAERKLVDTLTLSYPREAPADSYGRSSSPPVPSLRHKLDSLPNSATPHVISIPHDYPPQVMRSPSQLHLQEISPEQAAVFRGPSPPVPTLRKKKVNNSQNRTNPVEGGNARAAGGGGGRGDPGGKNLATVDSNEILAKLGAIRMHLQVELSKRMQEGPSTDIFEKAKMQKPKLVNVSKQKDKLLAVDGFNRKHIGGTKSDTSLSIRQTNLIRQELMKLQKLKRLPSEPVFVCSKCSPRKPAITKVEKKKKKGPLKKGKVGALQPQAVFPPSPPEHSLQQQAVLHLPSLEQQLAVLRSSSLEHSLQQLAVLRSPSPEHSLQPQAVFPSSSPEHSAYDDSVSNTCTGYQDQASAEESYRAHTPVTPSKFSIDTSVVDTLAIRNEERIKRLEAILNSKPYTRISGNPGTRQELSQQEQSDVELDLLLSQGNKTKSIFPGKPNRSVGSEPSLACETQHLPTL